MLYTLSRILLLRQQCWLPGYEAVCAFVNMDLSAETIDILNTCKVKLILMRCAGFNNVDLERAKGYGMTVTRVPSYSPEAVAEHAMALALTANRHTHKAYIKVRENNYSLNGLMVSTSTKRPQVSSEPEKSVLRWHVSATDLV